jgi:hypothetical protein
MIVRRHDRHAIDSGPGKIRPLAIKSSIGPGIIDRHSPFRIRAPQKHDWFPPATGLRRLIFAGDRKLLRELTGHRLAEDRVAIPITGAGGSRNSPRNRPLAGWLRAGPWTERVATFASEKSKDPKSELHLTLTKLGRSGEMKNRREIPNCQLSWYFASQEREFIIERESNKRPWGLYECMK